MKREKRMILPSRRRRALRRILIAAAALFLVNHILLVGLLFPIQAIRHNEERMGTGRTEVVRRSWDPGFLWDFLAYLTGNENAVMLSGARWTLYGWMDSFGVPVDCTEEVPIHGGWWSMNWKRGPSKFYVFGRIDDPDIDFLKVTVRHNGEPPEEKNVWRAWGFEWGLPREDFIEKDGQSYFLLNRYPVDWSEYPSGVTITALGYDKEGNEIALVELEQGASSSFG